MDHTLTNEVINEEQIMKDNEVDLAVLNKYDEEYFTEASKGKINIGQLRFTQYRVKKKECKRNAAGSQVARYNPYFQDCYNWNFND